MLQPPPYIPNTSLFPALDALTSQELSLAAAQVFQPRAPIGTRELFSGRWEQITTVVDAVSQAGLHIVIFGERGVGKSSLSNIIDPIVHVMEESLTGAPPKPRVVVKVNINKGDTFADAWRRLLDEIAWVENRPVIGLVPTDKGVRVTMREALRVSDKPSIDEIRRALMCLPRSVVIFDEFDRGSADLRTDFTDLVKALSDYAIDCTVVMVGVSETIDQLIQSHASIVRAIVQVKLHRMEERELRDILMKGEKALNIKFSDQAASWIVKMSQGLPHYTHLIGLHSSRCAINRLSRHVEITDVHDSFEKAIRQAVQGLQERYLKATHSAHKDALYEKVMIACAAASFCDADPLGWFHPADIVEPLSEILERSNVKIATFQKHINELHESERGEVLERSGSPRAYKYRFREPLLPPFIFMNALNSKIIDLNKLARITATN